MTSICAQIVGYEFGMIILLTSNPGGITADKLTQGEVLGAYHLPTSIPSFISDTLLHGSRRDTQEAFHLALIELNNYRISLREAVESFEQSFWESQPASSEIKAPSLDFTPTSDSLSSRLKQNLSSSEIRLDQSPCTNESTSTRVIDIFICYAHEDETLLQGLEKQLAALKRQGVINVWYDRNISAGADWKHEIDKHLDAAHLILLLVSPAFMSSDYCYGTEMKRAMERHEHGEARVIPVILRLVYWHEASFSQLQVLPTSTKPITGPGWRNRNEAFFDVAEGIRKVVKELIAH